MENQMVVLTRDVNVMLDELHKVFLGKPVLHIYLAALAVQKTIDDINPGIGDIAREVASKYCLEIPDFANEQ
jgi:hypothetical protein